MKLRGSLWGVNLLGYVHTVCLKVQTTTASEALILAGVTLNPNPFSGIKSGIFKLKITIKYHKIACYWLSLNQLPKRQLFF